SGGDLRRRHVDARPPASVLPRPVPPVWRNGHQPRHHRSRLVARRAAVDRGMAAQHRERDDGRHGAGSAALRSARCVRRRRRLRRGGGAGRGARVPPSASRPGRILCRVDCVRGRGARRRLSGAFFGAPDSNRGGVGDRRAERRCRRRPVASCPPAGGRMSKGRVLSEFWQFLMSEKKYWLVPIVIVFVLFGLLIALSHASAVAPFISTVFYPVPVRILGISAYYHDSAACLVEDGRIVAAAQEERFTRRKHDAGFPSRAVEYCLREAGVTAGALDFVA